LSKTKALLGLIGAILVYAIFVGFRSWWLHSQGQTIFCLQELWTPTAIVSILVVTFVERLVRPPAQVPGAVRPGSRKAAAPKKKAPKRKKR
jgi:hypothetical protein